MRQAIMNSLPSHLRGEETGYESLPGDTRVQRDEDVLGRQACAQHGGPISRIS
jgi:hypothetical protein